MKVNLISVTPDAEKLMSYCARVSNPNNQDNPDYAKLLKYCADHNHWSVFEQADMTVEIETSRAISAQILRHRSFTFQEWSQRYSTAPKESDVSSNLGIEIYEARRQDNKNRQNSIDDMSDFDKLWFRNAQESIQQYSQRLYQDALDKGIAKEQARFLLPLSTKTKIYMKGNVRSWIHYLQLRTDPATQKEHRDVANAIKTIFIEQFPTISKSLEWL